MSLGETSRILLIQTEGTIDKIYPNKPGAYGFVIDQSAAQLLLPEPIRSQVELVSVCRKDSQEIDDTDREKLVDAIRSSDLSLILITHGTDTIIETAKYLQSQLDGNSKDKCVLLTGATQPWSMKETDADFNVGTSLGFLIASEAGSSQITGVYVCMNGCVIPANRVYRDEISGCFLKSQERK